MSVSGLTKDQLLCLEQYRSLLSYGVRVVLEDTEVSKDSWDEVFKLNDRVSSGSSMCYMPDFIEGHKGRLDEIHLDKIYNHI